MRGLKNNSAAISRLFMPRGPPDGLQLLLRQLVRRQLACACRGRLVRHDIAQGGELIRNSSGWTMGAPGRVDDASTGRPARHDRRRLVGWGVVAKHVLYGLRVGGGEAVAGVLARRLGHDFELRESYWMGEYWLARIGSSRVKIVSQPDVDGDPVDAAFADYDTLVYVDGDDGVDLDGTAVEGMCWSACAGPIDSAERVGGVTRHRACMGLGAAVRVCGP